MPKVAFRIKIDVTKIDKNLLYKGNKGIYLDATCFMEMEGEDQYGNHGMVTQDVSKEAREAGDKGPILGNVKIFWKSEGGREPEKTTQAPADDFDSEPLPF